MGSDFDKFLDNIDKGEPIEVMPPAPPQAPVQPEDPLAKYVGHSGPIQDESPFDAFLGALEATASEEEKAVAEDKPMENHDWKAVRDALYEDDHDVWMCRRCCRTINVQRNQTLAQALEYYKVNPDCAVQITQEIHDS